MLADIIEILRDSTLSFLVVIQIAVPAVDKGAPFIAPGPHPAQGIAAAAMALIVVVQVCQQ